MAELTKQQAAWFKKLQRVLDECPFDTSDFDSYTTGDNDITVFKNAEEVQQHHLDNSTDLPASVSALDASVFNLKFPFQVASAAG